MVAVFDFKKFPRLTTRRLVLREITHEDARDIFAIRSDYEVTKYNSGAPLRFLEEAEDLVSRIISAYNDRRSVRWGITLRDSNHVIGMVGYNYWAREDNRASVGYDLARAYWGNSIMPEALQHVIQFGFEMMYLNRVEADCSVENEASARVLKKLGFQYVGVGR